jgi:hypothetical protein
MKARKKSVLEGSRLTARTEAQLDCHYILVITALCKNCCTDLNHDMVLLTTIGYPC